ncbi:MAG: hypothetical protein LBQ66_13220 [Planctomycetaceae bacterium]|nr:hypothetical protein [Planctomycetaceae bacterium]
MPNRLGVPSKLVRFPNAQRRAGRPRSSPIAATRKFFLFPLREKFFSLLLCGIVGCGGFIWYYSKYSFDGKVSGCPFYPSVSARCCWRYRQIRDLFFVCLFFHLFV